jgi:ATP synthase protein I
MTHKSSRKETTFIEQVSARAALKLKAQRNVTRIIWSSFGMMGLIGWSVTIPTLIGTLLGHIVDMHYPGKHSWTLTLMIIGLVLGCMNAWHWLVKEDRDINKDQEDNHE